MNWDLKANQCSGATLYHELLVDDHLADDGVDHGQLQLKHLGQSAHAGTQHTTPSDRWTHSSVRAR